MNLDRLNRVRIWFFRQKYRYDLASGYLGIINFALLIMAVKLPMLVRIPTLFVVGGALFVLWLFGYVMDVYIKAVQQYDRECRDRSVTWIEHNQHMEKIEKMLEELLKERRCG